MPRIGQTTKPVPKPLPLKVVFPADLPNSSEDPKLMAAKAHVLGCKPELIRELERRDEVEKHQWERIEALERLTKSLLTLIAMKK